MRLVGYNLLATEFGARAGTRVRLVPEGGKAVAAPVRDVNPFAITVAVPLMPEGRCRVEVSNNGGAHWGPVPGEGLTVVRTGKDPLGLGVAWAGAFAWDRRVNVADLQSGPADATAAIQRAIDACRAAGGGVVAIPAGEFRVASLRLPAGVVLLGEGQERTTLLYTGSGAPARGAGRAGHQPRPIHLASAGPGVSFGKEPHRRAANIEPIGKVDRRGAEQAENAEDSWSLCALSIFCPSALRLSGQSLSSVSGGVSCSGGVSRMR